MESPTSPAQNYTPLPSVKKGHPVGKKTVALILGISVLAISGFALLMMNLQQKTSLTGKAVTSGELCFNGSTPPLPIDPMCVDGKHVRCTDLKECNPAAWEELCHGVATLGVQVSQAGDACKNFVSLGCPRPREGYCKEKSPGACYECQFEDGRGFRPSFCRCDLASPTPTVPIVEKPKCEAPFQCLPPDFCVPDTVQKPSSGQTVGTAGQTNTGGLSTTKAGASSDACTPGTYCCVKKQPTPTPTKPTPSVTISQCPVPGLVQDIKITCPLCNKQP